MNLWRIEDGTLHLDFHAGQSAAWESGRRIVAMLAGTQGGKTSFAPWWLWREIRRCGPGDYLAVTDSFDLFKLKFLPAMREAFEHVLGWGRFWSGERILELADPATGQFWATRVDDPMWARIILRSADSKGGLESTSAKAAVLDEAGLDHYSLETYEAVLRRLSLSMGRMLLGTTLYTLNWVKTHILDRWRAKDPTIDVIQFDSIANPAFPAEEFARARATLPTWRFDMRYRGRDARPAGMIYDCFEEADVIPPFALPAAWPRFGGLDFGGVNTAALFYAQEPGLPPDQAQYFLYREYLAGGRTAAQHTAHLLKGEPVTPTFYGGSKSEGQWRGEFAAGGIVDGARVPGLAVQAPAISDVEVGITRAYGAHKRRRIKIFNTCLGYLGQIRSYARVLDRNGEPTEEIADKSTYHYMDAERYILGHLFATYSPGFF